MTRKLALCFLLEFSLRALAFAESAPDDDLKLEYVKFATEKMNPYDAEDQEYWSANWSVAAIFFDLDMDGRCDALVATSDQQLDRRFNWLPMRKTRDGSISIDYGRPPCVLAMCDPSAIYLVTLAGGSSLLLGKDCFVERYEESWERVWMERECDLIFRIDEAGGLAPQLDPFMVDKAVANPDFVRLERICPSWYRGYGLHCSPGADISEKANPSNGGLPAPADFPAFARRYREEVRRRLGIDSPVTVYAVFLDADDDGDTDFYVSSDAESAGGGKYRWTLYLDDAAVLRRRRTACGSTVGRYSTSACSNPWTPQGATPSTAPCEPAALHRYW